MTLEQQFGEFDFINDLDRGANNIIEFLKYSPKAIALVNSIMPEIQEVHDAQSDVYSTINIFDAVGTQLDDIFGTLLELDRLSGQSDEDYRLDLLGQATVLNRSGEISVMKALFKNLLGASIVLLFEYQPAAFRIQGKVTTIPTDAELEKIKETLTSAKQGGNNMSLSITDSATPFTLGSFTGTQLNDPLGLSGESFTGGTLLQGF